MSASSQLEYVEQQIEEHISFFTNRRNYNRRAAFRFTILPASLSALSAVAIGAAERFGSSWVGATALPLVALVASGVASVLGAWQAMFSNRKLWIANNTTLAGLYELRSDIEFRKADAAKPVSSAEVEAWYGRVKEIIDRAEKALEWTYSG